MFNLLRRLVRNFRKIHHNPDGTVYYDGDCNPGLQSYFVENRDSIFKCEVPKRYQTILKLVPGQNVIEIGSAEGTQLLLIAQSKQSATGYEKMDRQYATALELKQAWSKIGKSVESCEFVNDDIFSAMEKDKTIFDNTDTILMSRVIYHLRDQIPQLMEMIESSQVKYLMLVGCPNREERWKNQGERGDAMGRYAFYATLEGMIELAESINFRVTTKIQSEQDGTEPIMIAERQSAKGTR